MKVTTKSGLHFESHRTEGNDTWEFIACGVESIANEVAELVWRSGKVCEIDFDTLYGWFVRISLRNENQRERIGRRIAFLRGRRGITQQELAERTGMQQGNIARIEAGKYSARFDTLQTIAEAMGLTVDFVAGYQ